MRVINSLFLGMSLMSALYASDTKAVPPLKCNMTLKYPSSKVVKGIEDMFKEGRFYGRLRSNYFWSDKGEEHYVYGVGGSFIFKSAYFNGFGFTAGLYTTQNPWHMRDGDAVLYKAGKGVLNRYDVLTEGEYGMTSFAQAYLEYQNEAVSIKAGRLIHESFLTKSNDTKMIPNTFEGITFSTEIIPHTTVNAAFLMRQKLRDHASFHHLLAFEDDNSDPYAMYTQNDDTAMHQGLTLSKLKDAGIDDELIVFEAKNSTIDQLLLTFNYSTVPDLISSAMIEAKYRFYVDKLKISPALRLMKQFDNGAGRIGGANLKTNTFGYHDPDSLESTLLAARIDLVQDVWKLRFGYSKIADEGDIIAPWRGLPTGGFTRAMGQYNWYANTKTYMLRADYDFDKAGVLEGVKAFMRYAIQDFDDSKPAVQADSKVLTLDIIEEFESIPGLFMKIRMAHVSGDAYTIAGDGTHKKDPSYNEFRFEINYLF